MNLLEFYNNFLSEDIPNNLTKLVIFENDYSGGGYGFANGFSINTDYEVGLTYTDNPEFSKQLYPFAKANDTGSFYCIWDDKSERTLGEMPIVVFGDEGGIHIVAQNILELMHLLTYDVEIFVSIEEVFFYKSEEYYQPSEYHNEYIALLKADYNLEAITEAEMDNIIKDAQTKHKTSFDTWCSQFFDLS